VSEVFAKVYTNLHRFRPEHPFSTWLYRLAVNHVIDHGRRTKRTRAEAEIPRALPDPALGPGERLERRETARLVRTALGRLPRHYRDVLFLVYVEGMKVEDAAKTLGLPQGTVKTRLMRGRAGLRRILERSWPGRFGDGHAMP
jgi:RNA polymerase sigma-70 factor (ECF subfamily)